MGHFLIEAAVQTKDNLVGFGLSDRFGVTEIHLQRKSGYFGLVGETFVARGGCRAQAQRRKLLPRRWHSGTDSLHAKKSWKSLGNHLQWNAPAWALGICAWDVSIFEPVLPLLVTVQPDWTGPQHTTAGSGSSKSSPWAVGCGPTVSVSYRLLGINEVGPLYMVECSRRCFHFLPCS